MNFRRLRTGLWLVAFGIVATAGASVAQSGPNPNAPPPPPLPNATAPATGTPSATPTFAPTTLPSAAVPASPTPVPTPSSRPRRGRRAEPAGTPSPEASDTPAPPQFKTLDGVWEIELQPIGRRLATYQHFDIVQNGTAITGTWLHQPHNTKTPITGSFDGRLIQINATTGGATVTFSGYVENMGDMVGMQHLTAGDSGIAFTAQHRRKDNR